MTEADLIAMYGFWGECPIHPLSDWRHEVADDDTRLGYWQWVSSKMKEERNEEAA